MVVGDRVGIERPKRLCACVERERRGGRQRHGQRYAGSVVTFDRAETPGQVLSAAIRQLRRILERDARRECIGQTHATDRR